MNFNIEKKIINEVKKENNFINVRVPQCAFIHETFKSVLLSNKEQTFIVWVSKSNIFADKSSEFASNYVLGINKNWNYELIFEGGVSTIKGEDLHTLLNDSYKIYNFKKEK